ncbi:MAG TPA: hypothetical protein VN836_10130 [Verrucomicrobiae bacterium]|nr:hypothetical protein [Verrucomicrobiae bacterium]
MNLDEAQRQRVTAWILQGAKLSEIQTKLADEFGLRLTYMEVRLLVDDLKLTPKDPEPPKGVAQIGAAPEKGAPPPHAGKNATAPAPTPPPASGGVSVTVDQLARPGAIVSGKVTFSDGQQAEWYLDQTGRLGVVTRQQGYKPSAADVQQFQVALQSELARMGF